MELGRTGRRVGAVTLAVCLMSCDGGVGNPARWAGAPWDLVDAGLPDDRLGIIGWFRDVDQDTLPHLPPFVLGSGAVHMDVSFPDGDQGSIVASPLASEPECDGPCTTGELLAARASEEGVAVRSLDGSTDLPFVGATTEIASAAGGGGTLSELWFGERDGGWVFHVQAADPQHLRLVAGALADALAPAA
jgi:hypothetical protein